MRSRFTFVAAVAGTLFVAAPVKAQSVFFDNYCISSFNVCASVRVFASGNNLTMQIWNLNGSLGVSHTMTSIGLYHLGSSSDWTGTITGFKADWVKYDGSKVDVTKYWKPKWATDIKTLVAENIDLAEGTSGTTGGIVGCTDPGGQLHFATCHDGTSSFDDPPMLQFNFTLSKPFDLANVSLRWHSQQLPNGQSAKCDTGVLTSYGPCTGISITPEPVAIALLGTGLFGLGGAGLIRRRRGKSSS